MIRNVNENDFKIFEYDNEIPVLLLSILREFYDEKEIEVYKEGIKYVIVVSAYLDHKFLNRIVTFHDIKII